jgi:hypothetical protein
MAMGVGAGVTECQEWGEVGWGQAWLVGLLSGGSGLLYCSYWGVGYWVLGAYGLQISVGRGIMGLKV